jgi:hypothetical protein
MRFPWQKKKITTIKVYEYYEFCEKFPELISLSYNRNPDKNDWRNRDYIDLLENFYIIQRITLIRHIKKMKRRVQFDGDKLQNILLDRWQQFNLTDARIELDTRKRKLIQINAIDKNRNRK